MKLGVDYYPEHWPQERWAVDAKMMADLSLTYVRVGEFAWGLFEPSEEEISFDWLDTAIDILRNEGLQLVLGTPTPTPPTWLTANYDVLQRDERGIVLNVGSRRHGCANNPAYQIHSQRIVTAMAQHYGSYPGIFGWQVDNEFSCHRTTRCYCDHCRRAFQEWAQKRYKTLDHLNEAWGTIFWSATYTDWSQIPLPMYSSAQQSPSLQLDFRRFSSDSWVAYQKQQIDIIRKYAPTHQITHNYMGLGDGNVDQQDYFDLAADLDFVSWDNYPQGAKGPDDIALNHDMMRGFKQRGYWVMEQQPGVVNWHPYNRPVPPGQVRMWSYQGLAHGAEAMVYFRWRAARYGQEQYHMGVLRHDGSKTRLYDEATQLHAELNRLPNISRTPAEVAILFDFSDWWTIQIDPHQHDFSYHKQVQAIYHHLWQAGISVDIVRRGATDLRAYKTVIVPSPILIDEAELETWQHYVESGGRLAITCRAFVKNQSSVWTDQPLPAHLDKLLGVKLDEYLGIPPDMECTVSNVAQTDIQSYQLWADVLEPTTAEPLMVYSNQYWAGKAAATMNKVGQGVAVTIGYLSEPFFASSVWQTLGLNELALPFNLPAGVEATRISFEGGGEGLLLLNHHESQTTVEFSQPVDALLSEQPKVTSLPLAPFGVEVVRW
ncbi:beta-galactosidase [Anaerolineales bacterium HSG24]|nr:beta-galactosidase [Anaerolineales bacterium HSG24]